MLETLTPRYTEQAREVHRALQRLAVLPLHAAHLSRTFRWRLAALPRQVAARAVRRRGGGARLERGRSPAALKQNGLDENTLVMFQPTTGRGTRAVPGGLRGRKGSTYEGGVREPLHRPLPGQDPGGRGLPAGVAGTIDVLPTVAKLTRRRAAANAARRHRHLAAAAAAQEAVWNARRCSTSTTGTCSARAGGSGSCTSPATTPSPTTPRPRAAASTCRSSSPELYDLEQRPAGILRRRAGESRRGRGNHRPRGAAARRLSRGRQTGVEPNACPPDGGPPRRRTARPRTAEIRKSRPWRSAVGRRQLQRRYGSVENGSVVLPQVGDRCQMHPAAVDQHGRRHQRLFKPGLLPSVSRQ